MTRDYFVENVNTWEELLSCCRNWGCEECDNVCDADEYDEHIEDCLVDWARNNSWEDMRDLLNGLPEYGDHDYYMLGEYDDYVGVEDGDDNFVNEKENVLDWADDNSVWDDEPDDEDSESASACDEDSPDDDGYDVSMEGCSLGELFASGADCLQEIKEDENRVLDSVSSQTFTVRISDDKYADARIDVSDAPAEATLSAL